MAKPIVNGIEKDLQGKAAVVRINMLSGTGRALAQRFDVQGLPTTILLDPEGKVMYRNTGMPDRGRIVALAKGR